MKEVIQIKRPRPARQARRRKEHDGEKVGPNAAEIFDPGAKWNLLQLVTERPCGARPRALLDNVARQKGCDHD